MGHVGDPLGYNKAMMDEDYVKAEYRKAERWLNVVTMDPSKVSTDRVMELEAKLAENEAKLKAVEAKSAIDSNVMMQIIKEEVQKQLGALEKLEKEKKNI